MDVSQLCTSSESVQSFSPLSSPARREDEDTLVARDDEDLPILPPITENIRTKRAELSYATMTPTIVHSYPSSRHEKDKTDLQQVIDRFSLLCSDLLKFKAEVDTGIIDRVTRNAHEILQSLQLIEANKRSASEENEQTADDDSLEYDMIRHARNLQENFARPKYRRRSKRSMIGQRCHSCNTNETPEWRRGPDGARTLCNACGLHYSKLLRKGSITVQGQNFLTMGESMRGNQTNMVQSIQSLRPYHYPNTYMEPDMLDDHTSTTSRSLHDR